MGIKHRRVVAVDPGSRSSIRRAVASLSGGGMVVLEPGDHVIDSTVELPSGVALVGAGPELTTITLAPGSNCHAFTNADHGKGNEGIELRGFTLEGNMRTQIRPKDHPRITFACGGYFRRVKRLRVDTVVAHGIRQTAFHFNHCTNVELVGLEADELGWSGVSTSGTDDIVLQRVVVTNSGLDVRHSGIHLDGGTGAYIDAVVDTSTGNGIMLDSAFSPMTDVVLRATVRNAMRGLSLSGDHDNGLSNVCVSGDYSNNREWGVLVSNTSNVFIVDATIADNGTAGIVLQGRTGVRHCVVANSRISGSPDLVLELHGSRVSYLTQTTTVAELTPVEPLAVAEPASAASEATSVEPPAVAEPAATGAATPAAGSSTTATVSEDDSFPGTCNVCGEEQEFVRRNASLREGYRCARCKASLRYRGQADAILRTYAKHGSTTIAEIVQEPEFAALSFWEPGVLGPFREHFTSMSGYVMSDFWPDVPIGDERDGVRCEDIMALTFPDASFDLVLTSDIFEHVRKPFVGFAEVHRVLRQGGRHIFSIPVQEPWRAKTVERVDTTGEEDVNLLEPRYHLGPGNSQHIVYNDFGRDLLDGLDGVGFDTTVIRFESVSSEASRLLTFCCTRR